MQPWESRTHGLRQCIHLRAQGFLLDSCNFLTHGRRCRGNFLNIPRQGYRPEGAWHNHTKVLKSYGTVRISCRLDARIVDYYLLRVTKTFSKNRQRSEEHTSELQSLTNLVCRLLLEKKKKK